MKRTFDLILSIIGIIILTPLFIIISLLIFIDSKGGILYLQRRVGLNNMDFFLFKFRTMITEADKNGLLTVGNDDSRITKVGYFLRKYKLDELPQLFNIVKGDMSFVGPRPEVRKYVNYYDNIQLSVLQLRPGITDYASIKYRNESNILKKAFDPEKYYVKEIMPEKLKLNLEYIKHHSLMIDLKIIFQTFYVIIKE